MKLLEYFSKFLNESVNLNATRLEDLDGRVAAVGSALQEAPSLEGRVLDTIPQGSWAHKTIIRPALGDQFDADFLVRLTEDLAWNADPQAYNDVIWEALQAHGTYMSMATRKNRCVRVNYAKFCHVDVVPYVVLSSGRQVIINRTTNNFEETNPLGYTAWLQEKDAIANGNLRKAIRLLKYLRDRQDTFSIKSVLLTTLVGERINIWSSTSGHYQDLPTTLVMVVTELDAWLQAHPGKPHLSDPSCPATSFDHRWTEKQYGSFRDDIHGLLDRLCAAFYEPAKAASIDAWRGIFGASFPVQPAPKASATSVLKAAFGFEERPAPAEQFIENLFQVDITGRVSITCDVSVPPGANRAERRRQLRQRGGWVPKRRDLLFRVASTDVPAPYTVYWKVRNHGQEAKKRNDLRGTIEQDAGHRQKEETALYSGHHWVECYIVKDGTCVARAHEEVIIP